MTIKFSKDEQAFIDDSNERDIIAKFLVKNIGNQELNNRLYWKIEEQATLKEKQSDDPTLLTSDKIDNIKLLERWTYKTPTAQEIKAIANKIKIAKQLQAQGIKLLPEEKISLLELKQISRFSLLLGKKDSFREGDEENTSAKDLFNALIQSDTIPIQEIYKNSTNKEFKELYENMVVCEQLAADLRRDIFKSHTYKAQDILIRNEEKSAVIENVAQEGITPLQKQQDTRIVFFDMFDELDKDYPGRVKSTPKSSNKADISTINVTDILSSNIYRLPEEKLNDTQLMKQISEEKDPKKLEALLIANGAQKVPNSIAEEFVRTEDVKKSKTFNNVEDNLANSLETLAKSAHNQEEFVAQARPRIEAYLAVADLENNKTTPNVTAIDTELKNLYLDRNKSGIKAEIIKFISSTLVTLGLKKSTAEKTIQKIRGPFTKQLSDRNRNNTGEKHRT